MKDLLSLTLMLLVFAASSCQWKSKAKQKQPDDFHQDILLMKGEKNFYLDDETSNWSLSLHYLEKDSALAFYTDYNKTVNVFDYRTGHLTDKVDVGDRVKNVHEVFAYNLDSIFIYSFAQTTIFLERKDGSTVWKFPIDMGDYLKTFTLMPYLSTMRPVIYYKQNWYFMCSGLGEYPDIVTKREERPTWMCYHPANKKVSFLSGFPEFYIHNNMGTYQYWRPSGTFNPSRGELVTSFKASNQVNVLNLDNQEERWVSLKSHYFDTIPLPFKGKDRDYESQQESYYHYLKYPSYEGIFYDKYRHVYYRFILHGVEKPDLTKRAKAYFDKKMSILVADEDFNILGETPVYSGYYVPVTFVTPEGLHVLKLTNDENVATFTVFQLNPKYRL
ncbi:DUF4221 family protein [Prolixibacter denitrificans]|uniref:Uncharacterized protein DUF4221 n=2 Tax=Prolixibacter denitrificans TaxID=1541063 RepID=A0A2P8CBZ1_9BACT|nr:DUF4221 family protein [Prolixibacter denitrificans]PSK82480.1 uncharacterized protein DUF4221 [Prolixibacter denitrificans]